MVAAASQAGSWVAVVGMGDLGLGALVACGLDPGRVLLVDRVPTADWPRVIGALAAGVDVLVVAAPDGGGRTGQKTDRGRPGRNSGRSSGRSSGGRPGSRSGGLASGVGRRLATLARERGNVVVTMRWEIVGFEPSVRLKVVDSQWDGLDRGYGHLRRRRMAVERSGRGSAARRQQHWLWLPGDDGGVCAADPPIAGLDDAGPSDAGACDAGPSDAGATVLEWPGRGS